MAAFDTSHSQITKALTRALPDIDLPSIDLPDIDLPDINFPHIALPDTFNSFGTLANQLQSLIAAALSHPWWALGIVIVSIGLLQLVADFVKRILEAGLGLIITLPLRLSQWLWKQATSASTTDVNDTERIAHLLSRLETLQTEQTQIMGELKSLLTGVAPHEGIATDPKQPLPTADSSAPLAPQNSAESPQS